MKEASFEGFKELVFRNVAFKSEQNWAKEYEKLVDGFKEQITLE
jgi:hypothetical protein